MKRATAVPGLFFAAILVASTTAGAIGTRAAGQQYLKDVASADAALKTFDSDVHAWTNSTADSKGEHQAASTLRALVKAQKRLLSQTWPSSVNSGVRFICEEDISSLEEDLREIDGNSMLGNGAFKLTFSADSRTLAWDAYYVRRALGLPSSGSL